MGLTFASFQALGLDVGLAMARAARDAGCSSYWTAETVGPEAFATLGAVAASVGGLDLGTGVLALQLRTPQATAMGAATLQALAPDRDVLLGVGISSGANFIGALKVLEERGGEGVVVTVFPDDNKKYLTTDLLREEPERDTHLSPDVELLGFRSFKRVCHTCCDPLECLEGVPADFVEAESALPSCPRRMSADSCG